MELHLQRIALCEEDVDAVIAGNHHALEIADSLDRLRAQGTILGPLHGVPVALKDNIHTTELPTTGGALAFEGYTPPYKATLTELREWNLAHRDAGSMKYEQATQRSEASPLFP